jgi:hypothetical protein
MRLGKVSQPLMDSLQYGTLQGEATQNSLSAFHDGVLTALFIPFTERRGPDLVFRSPVFQYRPIDFVFSPTILVVFLRPSRMRRNSISTSDMTQSLFSNPSSTNHPSIRRNIAELHHKKSTNKQKGNLSVYRNAGYITHSVGRVAGNGLGDGVRFPAGLRHFSLFHRVKTGSGVHLASHPMGTRNKGGEGVKLTAHVHLVPRSRMVELYLHSHVRLRGVVLN